MEKEQGTITSPDHGRGPCAAPGLDGRWRNMGCIDGFTLYTFSIEPACAASEARLDRELTAPHNQVSHAAPPVPDTQVRSSSSHLDPGQAREHARMHVPRTNPPY